MADVTIGFNCRNPECEADLECELSECSRGHPGYTGGAPEDCYPGEGPSWSWPEEVKCPGCGTVHDEKWMDETLSGQVIERLFEPDEP